VALDPLGPHQGLETLIRGLFKKKLFLQYIRNFILFEEDWGLVKKIGNVSCEWASRDGVQKFEVAQRAHKGISYADSPICGICSREISDNNQN
jgi:type I site-specific restriction-modification system R (restriction) subunit